MSRSLVKNAADHEQVYEAKEKLRFNKETHEDDLKFILSSPKGRRFIYRMIDMCDPIESIYTASAAIHYNVGKQDIAKLLRQQCKDVDYEHYILMIRENEQNNNGVKP